MKRKNHYDFGGKEVWDWDPEMKRFVCRDGRRFRTFEEMKKLHLYGAQVGL